VDRFFVVDHQESSVYVLSLHDGQSAGMHEAQTWVSDTEDRIRQLQQASACGKEENAAPEIVCQRVPRCREGVTEFQLSRSKTEYIKDIQACMEELYAGNSYEICLTNMLTSEAPETKAWEFYKCLRTVNAAPYSAWMDFGHVRCSLHVLYNLSVEVCC
jgi:para-aminobenzoate synthetase